MPVSTDVQLGKNVVIHHSSLVNLYGCSIGDNTKIGSFVEIQKKSFIGKSCKISSHSFICEGVIIEDEVFIGHGVIFINDLFPRATKDGHMQTEKDWEVVSVKVKKGASVGSGSKIMCGVIVGSFAMVGAGTVVTKDVPDYAIMVGNPGRVIGDVRERESVKV